MSRLPTRQGEEPKKKCRGGWEDPFARASPTMKLWSMDARSWDHPSHPFEDSCS